MWQCTVSPKACALPFKQGRSSVLERGTSAEEEGGLWRNEMLVLCTSTSYFFVVVLRSEFMGNSSGKENETKGRQKRRKVPSAAQPGVLLSVKVHHGESNRQARACKQVGRRGMG